MITFEPNLITIPRHHVLHVACSMGIDSVVFSHFLSKSDWTLKLLYVNHNTPYSNLPEQKLPEFVKFLNSGTARSRKAPITYECLKGKGDFDTSDWGEHEFREYRLDCFHDFFSKKEWGQNLVVCHHLGDCVESYLMNCFNGVSNDKIIPKYTCWRRFDVIRPFLQTYTNSIAEYADRNDLMQWVVEDPSNKDLTFRRNWLRLDLIPQINNQGYSLETVVWKQLGKV